MPANRSVHIRLYCMHPPPKEYEGQPTEFGLQYKQQELHTGQQQEDGSLLFECEVGVRHTGALAGPFVHGTSAAPFLYLGWRTASGPPAPWIKRWKIALSGITPEQLDLASGGDAALEARISGSGSASVPLLGEGWCVVR